MSSPWSVLAEARIREWLARPAEERAASAWAQEPGVPLEVQLLQDIRALDELATGAPSDADASAMRHKADELFVRLAILLEADGKADTVRHLAEARAQRTR